MTPLVEVLRSVEWKGANGWEGDYHACPECKGIEPSEFDESTHHKWIQRYGHRGHRAGCNLSAALGNSTDKR